MQQLSSRVCEAPHLGSRHESAVPRHVFEDPDPAHSNDENRFIIIGRSRGHRLFVVVHAERRDHIRIISARPATRRDEGSMKAPKRSIRVAEMRKEYDFSHGVRGKYARRFAAGSRIIVLDPDVARVFPDSKTVNQMLRALTVIIRRQRRKAS